MVSTAGVHLVGRAQATLVHCGWLGKVAEKDRLALTPGLELLEHASTPSKILMFCFPIISIDAAHVERPWWGGLTLHSRRHLAELCSVTRPLTRPQLCQLPYMAGTPVT